MGRPFIVNLRSGGQRCGMVEMVNDRFGTHPGFRFVCDSNCGLVPKRASKNCRLGSNIGGQSLSLPSQSGSNYPAIQFVR
jgi:hypothetical protein